MKTLRELREESRLTVKELAKLFDVAPVTITRAESDSRNIKNALLKKYMDAFGVEYDELFLGSKYEINVFLREKHDKVFKNLKTDG